MADTSGEWSSDGGTVTVHTDGGMVVYTWFVGVESSPGPNDKGVKLVVFDKQGGLLRIFPKVPSSLGYREQFDQVCELQIETPEWDVEGAVVEDDQGNLALAGLPTGFGRIFAYGLGFPRVYRGIIHAIEAETSCKVVHFGPQADDGPKGNVFHVSLARFLEYKSAVDRNRNRGAVVVLRLNRTEAINAIADLVGRERVTPSVGRHPMVQAITRALTDETPLGPEERSALVKRMVAESKRVATESPEAFGRLRDDIDLVTLEVLIERFGRGLVGSMASDEARWQKFFENNTFALQQMFAAPVTFFGKQLELRIPSFYGSGGRVADFVLVNTVTRSTVVVEIKTPATKLLGRLYRGSAGAEVYPPSQELSGSVAQLAAQMESARTDLSELARRTRSAERIETVDVRGAVIVGTLAPLDQEQQASFMRYRGGLHGIGVFAFDEVRDRLQVLRDMLSE